VLGSVDAARHRGYRIGRSPKGHEFAYGLLKAASKFKLAASIRDVQFVDYAERTKKHYTGQIKLTTSFIAFEAYSRMRNGRNWYLLAADISNDYLAEARGLRESISNRALMQLRDSMDRQPLKDRIDRFNSGNMSEFISVACALRNGFAHGLYGSRGEFHRASLLLAPLLLKAIRDNCVSEVKELEPMQKQ
jgi:hypothetical protein